MGCNAKAIGLGVRGGTRERKLWLNASGIVALSLQFTYINLCEGVRAYR